MSKPEKKIPLSSSSSSSSSSSNMFSGPSMTMQIYNNVSAKKAPVLSTPHRPLPSATQSSQPSGGERVTSPFKVVDSSQGKFAVLEAAIAMLTAKFLDVNKKLDTDIPGALAASTDNLIKHKGETAKQIEEIARKSDMEKEEAARRMEEIARKSDMEKEEAARRMEEIARKSASEAADLHSRSRAVAEAVEKQKADLEMLQKIQAETTETVTSVGRISEKLFEKMIYTELSQGDITCLISDVETRISEYDGKGVGEINTSTDRKMKETKILIGQRNAHLAEELNFSTIKTDLDVMVKEVIESMSKAPQDEEEDGEGDDALGSFQARLDAAAEEVEASGVTAAPSAEV